MCEHDMALNFLESCYGHRDFLAYSDSGNETSFQASTQILDPQWSTFRSGASLLNELAISHRLSILIGRSKHKISDDFSLAIKSIDCATMPTEPVDGYHYALHLELTEEIENRKKTTTLKSIFSKKHGNEILEIVTLFNVVQPSLVAFVRRTRKFSDYADVKMDRDDSHLVTIDENHIEYFPSESDRLSDGKRVDHVPALTIIDIALSVGKMKDLDLTRPGLSAKFLSYTDPRQAFDIFQDADHGIVKFIQNDQVVAEICSR